MPIDQIQFDAHVHLYPSCDLSLAIHYSLENMQRYAEVSKKKIAARVWLLTERSDCHRYQTLLQEPSIREFKIERTDEKKAVVVLRRGEPVLYIMPGRQIITREGLELCALITHYEIADRKYAAKDAIKILKEAGAIVALNWAPGKWLFNRGRIVRNLIEEAAEELFISDTTMRPALLPTPPLMRRAVQYGMRLLYGSDPLPFKGEEKIFASYGGIVEGDFIPNRPASSLLNLLKNKTTIITPYGRRSNMALFAWRQWRIMQEKRKRS